MTARLDTLNALEEADAEIAAGMPLTALEDPKLPKVKLWCALAWVHKRREQPDLTFADHLKSGRLRDSLDYILAAADGSEDLDEGDDAAAAAAPFPEGGPAAEAADPGEAAGAEGPVLSGDRALPV